jgi:hypothetical protein
MSKLTGKVADVTGASKGMEPLSPSHSPAGDRARVIANIRVLRFGTTSGNRRKQSLQFSRTSSTRGSFWVPASLRILRISRQLAIA